MTTRSSYKRKNRTRARRRVYISVFVVAMLTCLAGVSIFAVIAIKGRQDIKSPEDILKEYMSCIPLEQYEKMYSMINVENSGNVSEEDFIKRNSAIYEGIEIKDMEVETTEYDKEQSVVKYHTFFETLAGDISFDNSASFIKGENGYELIWDDGLIFPNLGSMDKVKIARTEAERGSIFDRNGQMLAGKGTASSVGIVPGKLEDAENAIAQLAQLLEIEPESIQKKLDEQWVKEDSFVPIKTISKINEEVPEEKILEENLLSIRGVMISDTKVREYPLGEAAAHLVGYIQNVTAEDLENHPGEGYSANSVIGRSGMEGLYEKELKGQDGYSIYISDSKGNKKEDLAVSVVQNGEDIKLTIDSQLQKALYEQFKEDKSCSVAMNPYTGEVLALVSTPSFDNNDFILGMSNEEWKMLNESEEKPLYNRFRQTFSPGSSIKPIIASIGLQTGAIDPNEDYGSEGTSWQKDDSWGAYEVTTLHTYEPVILENALIYSDNIYFAKAALKIGADTLESSLEKLGFNQSLPFEITMTKSQYSNTEHIETEIQLADSGYGQGQVLVNPLHLATLYTSFSNHGDIVTPYLRYKEEAQPEIWQKEAFSVEVSNRVLEGLKQVVNNPNGTGYEAHMEQMTLAGKTGTAEIKASKEDTTGTELGWFAVFTTDTESEKPILLVSMVEDVKEIGGSGYVVKKDKGVLEAYFKN